MFAEEILDDAVFQRVEGDHGESSTRLESRHCLRKDFLNGSQFLIYSDPQRLKCPRCRMQAIPSAGRNRWVSEWRLPSEPWVFLVGRDGRIRARFEGSVSAAELSAAVQRMLRV